MDPWYPRRQFLALLGLTCHLLHVLVRISDTVAFTNKKI
jgi:hypothetical protein